MPYTIGRGIDELEIRIGTVVRIRRFDRQPTHWADEMMNYRGMLMNIAEVIEEDGCQQTDEGLPETPKIFMRELKQYWWLLSDLEPGGNVYKRYVESQNSKDPNILFRKVSDV